MNLKSVLFSFALISSFSALAQQSCRPPIPGQAGIAPRFEVLSGSNGAELIDRKNGTIWKRCVEGMSWAGSSCTGTPTLMTWQNANDLAKNAPPSTIGNTRWRLPTQLEALTTVDHNCVNPAVNLNLFPATPKSIWAEAYAEVSDNAWYVYYYLGNSAVENKKNTHAVRLARSLREPPPKPAAAASAPAKFEPFVPANSRPGNPAR